MKVLIGFLFACFLLVSCQDRDRHGKPLDTPTSGSITIAADESLRPLVETEVSTFNSIYTKANVDVIYGAENDVIDLFLRDSVKQVIVTRHLSDDERKFFKDKKITVTHADVALSGIALIVHRNNPDTALSVQQLREMLQGKISSWNQLNGKKKDGIEIVFDNPGSGTIRYLKDSLAKVEKLPANCFAVQNNEAVVDHVAANVNSLGLIGLEWISDSDDSTTNQFLEKVKVVAISGDSTHFQPYQAYIALKHYPLIRTVTIITNASRTGLTAGFSRFFQSEPGQRIVLKAGLVPKTMPVRIVEVNPKPFKIEK